MLIAHRGYSDKFKDNSLQSFMNALDKGFDMIELDINICKSGEIVVYHDLLIGCKNIQQYSLEELKQYDIITLDTYFKWNNNRILSYLDVKGNEIVIDKLIQYLQNNTFIDLSKLYVASFDFDQVIVLIKSKLPIKCGLITSNKVSEYELSLINKNIEFISFNWEYYDNIIYKFLNKRDINVFLYTCHDKNEELYISANLKYDGLVSNIYIDSE
jgi:glycerophosphoryl diester phosphodiesterase